MMKRLFWMLIAAGCLAVACDKTGRQPAETRFSAQFEPIGENMDAVETRSNISDAGAFVWNDWDQIDVHSSGGSFVPFALRDGAGMKTASFAGILPEGEEADGVAVYPSGEHVLSGRTLTVHYPDTYTYPADTTDSCPVMVATLENGALPFRHVGGLMRIRYKNVPVKATHLVVTFDRQVTGDFDVDLDAEEPAAVMKDGSSTVTINFTSPSEPRNTRHFYLPLPTGTLKSIHMEFRDASDAVIAGTSYTSTSTAKVIKRARLLKMPGLVLTVIEGGTPEES